MPNLLNRQIKSCKILFLYVVLSCACTPIDVSAKVIRFAPQSQVSEAAVAQQFLPFTHYLSDVTKQQIEQRYYETYKYLIDDLIADKIDLAYLGPLSYVLLKRQDPDFIPVVRFVNASGGSTYTCSLVSFDKTLDLEQLNEKTPIALPQPYSTCAYLMTEYLLNQQNLSMQQLPYYYAGNHSKSALDVIRGKATIAGMKTSVAEQYRHLGLKIKEQLISLPEHLLVANPRTLSAELIEQIRSTLLTLDLLHNQKHKEITSSWGEGIRYGAIPVKENDYQCIEELLAEIKIPGIDE